MNPSPPRLALAPILVLLLAGTASAEDRGPVCPNGLSMYRIRGYEDWTFLAAHLRTDKMQIRYMLGNETAAASFRKGAGAGGKKFAEGSIIVKVKYDLLRSPDHETSIEPRSLKSVEYMVKDSGAFAETDGWGYAAYPYHDETRTFSAGGDGPVFHHKCHECHAERVARKDFVFTDVKHPKFLEFDAGPEDAPPLRDFLETRGPAEKKEEAHHETVVAVPTPSKTARDVICDGNVEAGEYAFRAELGGGALVLHWRVQGPDAAFAVEGKTEGWIALGFDPSEAMKGADMIVAWVDDSGQAFVRDEFCTDRFGPHESDIDLGGRNNILAFGGKEENGVTVIEFRRMRDTGDKFDKAFPVSGSIELIWALGGSDDTAQAHVKRGEADWVLGGGEIVDRPVIWPIHAAVVDFCTVLLVISMLIARRRLKDRNWLPKHQTLGLVSPGVLTVGLFVAFFMVGLSSTAHFRVPHAYFGGAAGFLTLAAPVLGFAMFKAPDRRDSLRALHVWVGRAAILALLTAGLSGFLAAGVLTGW